MKTSVLDFTNSEPKQVSEQLQWIYLSLLFSCGKDV